MSWQKSVHEWETFENLAIRCRPSMHIGKKLNGGGACVHVLIIFIITVVVVNAVAVDIVGNVVLFRFDLECRPPVNRRRPCDSNRRERACFIARHLLKIGEDARCRNNINVVKPRLCACYPKYIVIVPLKLPSRVRAVVASFVGGEVHGSLPGSSALSDDEHCEYACYSHARGHGCECHGRYTR